MPITESDLETRLSAPAASAGNQLDQDDADASLGGFVSRTVWAGGALHDLFEALTGDQNAAARVDYRCVFVVNKHATLTWTDPKLWVSTDTDVAGAEIAVGIDPVVASPVDDETQQARISAAATTAPTGVAFSKPLTKLTGLSLGDIPPGYCRAFWVRRTATDSAQLAGEYADLALEGDTL